MTQDSDALATAKLKKEIADTENATAQAKKATAEANLATAKAVADLATNDLVSKANQEKALADAEAAVLAKRQAAANAEAALITAQQANFKSKFGTVTENTVKSGEITASAGAGTLEANLLSAIAIDRMGKTIAADLSKIPRKQPDSGYVIFTGTVKPSFTNLRVFDLRYEVTKRIFEKAKEDSNAAADAFKSLPQVPVVGRLGQEVLGQLGSMKISKFIADTGAPTGAGALATGAGAVLDDVSKIASYFQTSYTVAKLDITGSDDNLLATSVASNLSGVYLPGRWLSPDKSRAAREIDFLSIRRTESAGMLAIAQDQLKDLQGRALKETDEDTKADIAEVVAAYKRAIASHGLAQKTFDEFLTALSTQDAAGVSLISKIADEDFTSSKILKGALSVFLHVHAVTGASYTKKSLWSSLFGMPFFVAGGAVVSYIALDQDGMIVGSGQLQDHGGYCKAGKVAKTVIDYNAKKDAARKSADAATKVRALMDADAKKDTAKEDANNAWQMVNDAWQTVKKAQQAQKDAKQANEDALKTVKDVQATFEEAQKAVNGMEVDTQKAVDAVLKVADTVHDVAVAVGQNVADIAQKISDARQMTINAWKDVGDAGKVVAAAKSIVDAAQMVADTAQQVVEVARQADKDAKQAFEEVGPAVQKAADAVRNSAEDVQKVAVDQKADNAVRITTEAVRKVVNTRNDAGNAKKAADAAQDIVDAAQMVAEARKAIVDKVNEDAQQAAAQLTLYR